MSAETASTERPRPGPARTEATPGALRVLAMAAVGVGLAALAGGTFVLSYSGIHALALHAGIAPRLARGYPLLLDAMLVIVLAAVLALRGADLPSRLLAWITLLAVLAAAAGADALHAAGRRLPGHVAAITAAVLPWVLVFLAFALLLAMLRHARLRRLATTRTPRAHSDPVAWHPPGGQHEDARPPAAAATAIASDLEVQVRQPQPASALPPDPHADTGSDYPVVQPVLTVAHQPEPSAAVTAIDVPGSPEAEQPGLAVDAEPWLDDPTSDEAAAPELAGVTDQDQVGQADEDQPNRADKTGASAEQAQDVAEHDEQDDPDMPVFHRMWSSPTPPEPLA